MKPENTVPLTQYELIDGPELAARWKVTAVVPEFRRLCAVTSRGAEKRIATHGAQCAAGSRSGLPPVSWSTTPFADFCGTVRVNRFPLSHVL
jgi:hypothetical protein